MILTDREIQQALRHRQIDIDLLPPIDAFSSTSVDLTLDEHFQFWKQSNLAGVEPHVICPGEIGFSFDDVKAAYTEKKRLKGGYVLDPGSFVLAWTREWVTIPVEGRLAARVEGKSSLAGAASASTSRPPRFIPASTARYSLRCTTTAPCA